MATKECTCFTAVCDGCGNEYEHDYTPHWPSAGEAADDAAEGGEWWHGKDGALLCDHCKLKPHAFAPSEYLADDCDRCGLAEDEHDEAGDAR